MTIMPDVPEGAVAVTGMAGRFPGAATLNSYWQNLVNGTESLTHLSKETLRAAGVSPTLFNDPRYVAVAATIDEYDHFDAALFGMTLREAKLTDPQHRLFLELSREALEASGHLANPKGLSIGVFGGAGGVMSSYLVAGGHINGGLVGPTASAAHIGNDKDFLCTRVAFKLDLRGPAVTVQTACSSSLVAVHMACQSLLAGECDMTLAGGVTLRVPHQAGYLYRDGDILSPDGHCRPFDQHAAGTIFGSGAGVVVLRPLRDAIADGDMIHAVIRGTATSNDGAHKTSYWATRADGQISAMRQALASAQIDPARVGLIEAHGTGTALGDAVECMALSRVYGPGREPDKPCALGSVKSNIGHLEAAAGIASFIKAVLALKHETIPPTLHVKTPNPKIDFSAISPVTAAQSWIGASRWAAVNSLGVGGTNAHVLLCEAPAHQPHAAPTGQPEVLCLSAATQEALHKTIVAFSGYLRDLPETDFPSLCHTVNSGRPGLAHRAAIVATSCEQAADALEKRAARAPSSALAKRGTIAFLFSGQGSQYPGMAAELYRSETVFRDAFDACARHAESILNTSLHDLVFDATKGSDALQQTENTQPALFAVEWALAQLWLARGVTPSALLGHSVGEYVAACLAGVFPLDAAVRIVATRGKLMAQGPDDGAMLAVLSDPDTVAALLKECGERLSIAAINGPASTTVAGTKTAIRSFSDIADARAISSVLLPVSQAFHSHLLDPILGSFESYLRSETLSKPSIPVVSNLDGSIGNPARMADPAYWVAHMRQTVQFSAGISTLLQNGVDTFIEVGPKPQLLGLARHCTGRVQVHMVPSIDGQMPDDMCMAKSYAQLFENGERLNLHRSEEAVPPVVQAPPTMQQKERFWMETPAVENDIGHDAGHPVLGQKVDLPHSDETRFAWHLCESARALLDQHRLWGRTVVPAAYHVAVLIEAARALQHQEQFRLEDIVFPASAVLLDDVKTRFQLIVRPVNTRDHTLTILASSGPDAAWKTCCKARLTNPGTDQPSDMSPLGNGKDTRQFHAALDALGYNLGSAFCRLTRIERNGEMAAANLSDPGGDVPFAWHPGLLDSCYQLTLDRHITAMQADPSAIFVPFAIEHLEVFGPALQGDMTCRITQQDHTSAGVHADLVVGPAGKGAADGRALLAITGLSARLASRDNLLGSNTADLPVLHQMAWTQTHTVGDTAATAQNWIVLADPVGSHAALLASLRAQGIRVSVVAPAPLDDLRSRLSARLSSADHTDAILCLATPDRQADGDDTLDSTDRATKTMVGSFIAAAQTLAGLDTGPVPRLVSVTFAAQKIEPSEALGLGALQEAPLFGYVRVAQKEHPEFRPLMIDLDGARADVMASCLTAELALDDRNGEVAYRGTRRFAAHVVPVPTSGPKADCALVDPDRTVLITGAFGALAARLALWLVHSGARHIALVGRTDRSHSTEAQAFVAQLKDAGAHVTTHACDLAANGAADTLLTLIQANMPPLGAVFHLAGVLDDAALITQDLHRFETVFRAKAKTAWALHRATKTLGIDRFVMFSSIASFLGTAGQSNYAAANAYLDSLAEHRHALGLPALSINWGTWADTGMASRLSEVQRRKLDEIGLPPLQPDVALGWLGKALVAKDTAQICVQPIDWPRYRAATGANKMPTPETTSPQHVKEALDPCDLIATTAAQVLGCKASAIDPDESLLDLGLDSLGVIELRTRIRDLTGISIPSRAVFETPNVTALARLIRRNDDRTHIPAEGRSNPPAERDHSQQALSGQAGLWALHMQQPDSAAYNIALATQLVGPLDADVLRRATKAVHKQHDALKCRFFVEHGKVKISPAPESTPEFAQFDLTGQPRAAQQSMIASYHDRPFDLEHGPLLRFGLFRICADRHVLTISVHHIVGDFTSLELLMRDLEATYRAQPTNETAATQPPKGQHLLQMREQAYLSGGQCTADRLFWRDLLRDCPPPVSWPSDSRPAKTPAAAIQFNLAEQDSALLLKYCRDNSVTPLAVFLAVWAGVVARYSAQDDCVIGTPVSLRDEQTRSIVGYQINMLPVRLYRNAQSSFRTMVLAARDSLLDGLDHRALPFAEILVEAGATGGDSRHPLFQSIVAFQTAKIWQPWSDLYLTPGSDNTTGASWAGLALAPWTLAQQQGQVDALLEAVQSGDIFRFVLKTDTRHISESLAQCLSDAFRQQLGHWLRHPDDRLADADLAGLQQGAMILPPEGMSRTQLQQSFPELFAAAVSSDRLKDAVICGDDHVSYGELDDRSTALAAQLVALGVGQGDRVAVSMRPSTTAVVAMLAVMRAGGAYVPIHPATPSARAADIVETGSVKLAISDPDDPPTLPETVTLVSPDVSMTAPVVLPYPAADSAAYAVFTSGSTGTPKGVVVSHAALTAMLQAVRTRLDIRAADRSVWFHEASFDFSVWEIWSALSNGGTLIVVPEAVRNQPDALFDLIDRSQVTILSQTPSALALLLGEIDRRGGQVPKTLCKLVLCGEALPVETARRAVNNRLTLWNLYGVAEAAVFSTAQHVTKDLPGTGPVPLGVPLGSAAIRIIDPYGRALPDFFEGEIELRGPSLAQRYLGLPDQNAARFGDSPDSSGLSRWYRTGDMGHWDGQSIHYRGRRDTMVKLRGHRVELVEVENALLSLDGVRHCAATVSDAGLWAFVVPTRPDATDPDAVRVALRALLPGYMIPERISLVPALARTRHGKLDRAAMVADAASAPPTGPAPPHDNSALGLASDLHALWRDALGRDDIPQNANFFDLGGTSVSLMQVHAALARKPGLGALLPSDLFRHTTLRSLRAFVEKTVATADTPHPVSVTPPRRATNRPIAVIGMALRLQGAATPDAFWSALVNGRRGLARLRPHELRQAGVPDDLIADSSFVPVDTALPDRSLFDPEFFGISQREAARMDPQHRLMLESTWELLERIGYDGPTKPRIGLFAASAMNTYLLNVLREDTCDLASQSGTEIMLANDKDFLPARISYTLGLTGPSMAVQTGCSSSLVAVHQAIRSLQSGECDIALAGGVSVHVTPLPGYRHEANLMFSPDGNCRAFDAAAAGTPFADGLGLVALRQLDVALSSGDHIDAVIQGSATNNDGASRAGFAAPGVDGQVALLRAALADAGLTARDIGFVEAHGTGTALGDAVEVAALKDALGSDTGALHHRVLGAVKANVGHLAAAAGVIGLIKTILTVKHGTIPPHPSFKQANPALGLDQARFLVNTTALPWPMPGKRRAGVSSFGLGGSNAHVVLEEPPHRSASPQNTHPELPPDWQIAPLSARSCNALQTLARATADELAITSDMNTPDIATTLQLGRRTYGWRYAVLGRSPAEFARALDHIDPAAPAEKSLTIALDDSADLRWLADRAITGVELIAQCLDGTDNAPMPETVLTALDPGTDASAARLVALVAALQVWKRASGGTCQIIPSGRLSPLARDVVAGTMTLRDSLRRIADAPEHQTAPVGHDDAATVVLWLCKGSPLVNAKTVTDPCCATEHSAGWFLRVLADCWARGVDIQWPDVPFANRGRRMALPSHPLTRRHCWWTGETETSAQPKGHKAAHLSSPRLFRESWQRGNRLGATARKSDATGKTCLVLADRRGLLLRLLDQQQRCSQITVTPADTTTRVGPRDYRIDLGNAGAGSEIAAMTAADGHCPDAVLCGWGFEEHEPSDFHAAVSGQHAFVELLRGLPGTAMLPVDIVTNGACDVTGEEAIVPLQTGYVGLVPVLQQEFPRIAARVLDLDSMSTGHLADMRAQPRETTLLALRGNNLWTRHFNAITDPGTPLTLTPGAPCLVTGGLGPIGMTLGRALWEASGTPLILTTSSMVPPRDEWPRLAREGNPRFARLQEWQRDGIAFDVVQADVNSRQQMAGAVTHADAMYGPARSFLHCAGVPARNATRWIAESSLQDWQRIMAPKVQGAMVLHDLFQDRPLELGYFVSSLSVVLGGHGLAAYAAAHAMLDGLVQAHCSTRPYLSVAWDGWTSWGDAASDPTRPDTEATKLRDARALSPQQVVPVQNLALCHIAERRLLVSRATPQEIGHTQPNPHDTPHQQATHANDSTSAEDRVSAIWQAILGSAPDPDATFFDQGGDSLRAIELVRQVNAAFGSTFAPPDFFAAPTVAGLVRQLENDTSVPLATDDRLAERRRARRRQQRARSAKPVKTS